MIDTYAFPVAHPYPPDYESGLVRAFQQSQPGNAADMRWVSVGLCGQYPLTRLVAKIAWPDRHPGSMLGHHEPVWWRLASADPRERVWDSIHSLSETWEGVVRWGPAGSVEWYAGDPEEELARRKAPLPLPLDHRGGWMTTAQGDVVPESEPLAYEQRYLEEWRALWSHPSQSFTCEYLALHGEYPDTEIVGRIGWTARLRCSVGLVEDVWRAGALADPKQRAEDIRGPFRNGGGLAGLVYRQASPGRTLWHPHPPRQPPRHHDR